MSKTLVFKRIIIGSDHAAFEMKNLIFQFLKTNYKSLEVFDAGTHSTDSVDYPDIAKEVCTKIQNKEYDGGILLCGSGIGISIAANKFKGIRCALCHDSYTATMSRMHNNANILSFGGRTTGIEIAKEMCDKFLTTEFLGDRHQRRLDKISNIENEQGLK